jgi:hypothetical protein
VLKDRDKIDLGRRSAATLTLDQPRWEVQLVRNQWYSLEHTMSDPGAPPNIIDLRNVQDDPYVYAFKP